jgi:hypothetical protein
VFGLALLDHSRELAAEPVTTTDEPLAEPLDLRWGTAAALALAIGVASVVQSLGYGVTVAVGGSAFFWVTHPGPAVTSALIGALGLALGSLATTRAARATG